MRFQIKNAHFIAPSLFCATLLMTACNGPSESASVNAESGVPQIQQAKTTQTDFSGGQVGKTASAFALPDADGKMVDLKTVLGTKPVVLVFYRGNW